MKLFPIRGGIHPESRKELTSEAAIAELPLPEVLHVPLHQHMGTPAQPLVERGDLVRKGQLLATDDGVVSASVHAPTSGKVIGIGPFPAPHASGLTVRTVTIKPDGADAWGDRLPTLVDPLSGPPEAIARRVADCGIVGMGGATFPSAIKLTLGDQHPLHTLMINGAECEPYLTCDDRTMREKAAEVVDGARLMAHALGVRRILFGIEANKRAAMAAIRDAVREVAEIEVAGVPTRYPMGSEKHLVQAVTGLETPAQGLTAQIGYVVHNVATAFAVYEAVREGRPLIDRVVTVSGKAIRTPGNYRVRIGTPISALLDACGGLKKAPDTLLLGGPMMGQPLVSAEVPVVKGMNGILALTRAETRKGPALPCIRCGTCVDICPCGLVPPEMMARVRRDDLQGAMRLGLGDCMSCGSCSYVCPSHIPLVQYFNHAKGKVKVLAAEEKRMEGSKDLAARRTARLERELQAKKDLLARRKAEAKAKAAAAEKASEKTAEKGEPAPEPAPEKPKVPVEKRTLTGRLPLPKDAPPRAGSPVEKRTLTGRLPMAKGARPGSSKDGSG